MRWRQVILLGEDRAHVDFLRLLCTQFGWRIVDEHVAPKALEAASGWVIRQFAERLTEVRAGYAGTGLLAAVDGDNVGREARERAIAGACADRGVQARGHADEVALFVPTWSIDTWALFFVRGRIVPENEKSKRKTQGMFERPHPGFLSPGVPAEDAPRVWKRRPLMETVNGFLSNRSHPELPSIDWARAEFSRGTQA